MQVIATKGAGAFKWGFKNNKMGLFNDNESVIVQTTTTQTDMAAFHHYVVTKRGSMVKLYVDAIYKATAPSAATVTAHYNEG
jgi:hypothetical protein